jgi:hypothetical protein
VLQINNIKMLQGDGESVEKGRGVKITSRHDLWAWACGDLARNFFPSSEEIGVA